MYVSYNSELGTLYGKRKDQIGSRLDDDFSTNTEDLV